MTINLDETTRKAVERKINTYLRDSEFSKCEFSVNSDGTRADLISYKTQRPEPGFLRTHLDVLLVFALFALTYFLVCFRTDHYEKLKKDELSRKVLVDCSEHITTVQSIHGWVSTNETCMIRHSTNEVAWIEIP